jgi:hypothetical protein
MANSTQVLSATPNPFPEDLVAATAREAESCADWVILLTRHLGYDASPVKPIVIDREVLLFLGAVLWLHSWEIAGISIHCEAGLPRAADLLTNAARALAENGTKPDGSGLSKRVMRLFVENFAWDSRGDLAVPVVLDGLAEDMAVDALAELLWSRRRAERGGER